MIKITYFDGNLLLKFKELLNNISSIKSLNLIEILVTIRFSFHHLCCFNFLRDCIMNTNLFPLLFFFHVLVVYKSGLISVYCLLSPLSYDLEKLSFHRSIMVRWLSFLWIIFLDHVHALNLFGFSHVIFSYRRCAYTVVLAPKDLLIVKPYLIGL